MIKSKPNVSPRLSVSRAQEPSLNVFTYEDVFRKCLVNTLAKVTCVYSEHYFYWDTSSGICILTAVFYCVCTVL